MPPFTRKYETHPDSAPSLLDLLAQSLINVVNHIEIQGLHREYVRREADTSFPRGRILMNETTRRHIARGVNHKVRASWFEPTADTAPNRCLKYTIWYLAQRYKSVATRTGTRKIIAELNRLYRVFDGAELDLSTSFLKESLIQEPDRIPSIRAYYVPAINLALTIIHDRGIKFDGREDRLLMSSMIWSMEKITEAYLREVLRFRLQKTRSLRVLDGNKRGPGGAKKLLFDEAPSEPATPDIVIAHTFEERETWPVVMDVKYKIYEGFADRPDIEQVVTYGLSYRSPNVVLVHPRIRESHHGLFTIGRMGPLTIHQHAFDFGAADLEVEESLFAERVRDLALQP